MESGLPDLEIFYIIVKFIERFEGKIKYFYGWPVHSLSPEDQLLLTLMKLRQNYTFLHLASLFKCSRATVSNKFLTYIHILSKISKNLMKSVPSRHNKMSAPNSFKKFPNCRIIFDCTNFRMAVPPQMDIQSATYSSYRSMNSLKILVGVAPNGFITYVSNAYLGSTSDKQIVAHCGLLNQLESGDMIMADKGFLIHDILPKGVSLRVEYFQSLGKNS